MLGSTAARTKVIRRLGKDFYLDALREGDKSLTPHRGEQIEMRFGQDNRYWAMPIEVVDVLEPLPILIVKQAGPPQGIESRQVPRARIQIPLEYTLQKPGADVFATTTLDLSATSLRFPSVFRTWVGLELRMTLRLAQLSLNATGRVVRVAPRLAKFRGRDAWETAVQFVNISPDARKVIHDTVMQALQRETLRKFKPHP